MITLVFLVCMSNGQCFSTAPDAVFSTEEQCMVAALTAIEANKQAVGRGEIAPHDVIYQCINWGAPA